MTSEYKISVDQNMERDHSNLQSSSLLWNSEAIEQLRHHWQEYISGLKMTPTELQLSKARADRALDLARCNQNRRLGEASQSSKCDRPLTDLYNSPRTTCRMKKILDKEVRRTRIEVPDDENHYYLCPQCGLVKDYRLTHEKHAEKMRQRLKRLVAKHPNLQPSSQTYL
ncbi:hypothetical protein KR200_004573 [Drosophila serrata]|nr:hypothetical protein KR200_004573 [Drosophila serrata]